MHLLLKQRLLSLQLSLHLALTQIIHNSHYHTSHGPDDQPEHRVFDDGLVTIGKRHTNAESRFPFQHVGFVQRILPHHFSASHGDGEELRTTLLWRMLVCCRRVETTLRWLLTILVRARALGLEPTTKTGLAIATGIR